MADESVQGIPDVAGLREFVEANTDAGQSAPQAHPQQTAPAQQTTQTEPPPQGRTEPPTQELDLAQFKTPKDLLKGYKEVQGAFTRTTQENKALKDQVTQLQAQFNEQMELMRLSQFNQTTTAPQPITEDFDQKFIQNPQQAVESLAERKAQAIVLQSKVQDALEEENLKSPGEFRERYQYAQMLSRQYPQLVTSRAGVKKLFELGDKLRTEQQKNQAYRAVKQMFGEDADLDKIRALIGKPPPSQQLSNNNAYMPDTSSGIRNTSEPAAGTNIDAEINDAVNKGDPDAVITALFKRQGLR